MAHRHAMICHQVTVSGDAEWPKVADTVIEAGQASEHPQAIQSWQIDIKQQHPRLEPWM